MRLLQPSITAEPPTTMERDAKVPKPSRRYVVEPCRMRTRSNGSLRVSAATCAKVVSSPCPSTDEPTRITEPSRSTVMRARSPCPSRRSPRTERQQGHGSGRRSADPGATSSPPSRSRLSTRSKVA